jgi:hypothetical protein
MKHTRRDFMKFILALTAAGFVPVEAIAGAITEDKYLILGTKNKGMLVNLTKQTFKEVEIGFKVHSYISHPKSPLRFIAIDKWDAHAAHVDFETGTVTPIHIEENMPCFGHGAYVEEKNAFFISCVSKETGKGYLTGYDVDTLKPIYEYQVAPTVLHDCHWLPDKTMIIASSGVKPEDYTTPTHGVRIAPSSVRFVDILGGGKIIRELSIYDPNVSIGHLGIAKGGQIFALTSLVPAARQRMPGQVYYSPDGVQPLRPLDWGLGLASKLKNEMLSIVFNSDHTRAAITNPEGEMVVLVDVITGKVLKALSSPIRGIAFDSVSNQFIGNLNNLVAIDTNFNEKRVLPISNSDGFQMSHSRFELI